MGSLLKETGIPGDPHPELCESRWRLASVCRLRPGSVDFWREKIKGFLREPKRGGEGRRHLTRYRGKPEDHSPGGSSEVDVSGRIRLLCHGRLSRFGSRILILHIGAFTCFTYRTVICWCLESSASLANKFTEMPNGNVPRHIISIHIFLCIL